MKLTAQIWNSSPEDSSVKNMASGAKTPKIGGKSSIKSKLSTGQLKNSVCCIFGPSAFQIEIIKLVHVLFLRYLCTLFWKWDDINVIWDENIVYFYN